MATIKELEVAGLKVKMVAGEWRVENPRFETVTYITPETLEARTADQIVVATHQGRNVDHITRVTGYFAKTKGWNAGKMAELKDRHRNTIEKEAA